MSYLDKGKMIKRLHREYDVGYHGEKLRQIELVRVGENGKHESVFDWGKEDFLEPADMASQIDEKITEDVEGQEASILYYRVLFRHGTSTQHRNGAFPCRVENINYQDPDMGEMTPLENPSPKGLARMHMDALHKYMQLTQGMLAETQRVTREIIRNQGEELQQMRSERLQTFRFQQDLLDRSQERALALKGAERWEEAKGQAFGMLAGVAPVALGQFLEWMQKKKGESAEGGSNLPSKESFLIMQFMQNLTPDQRQGFIAALAQQIGEAKAAPMLELLVDAHRKLAAAPEQPQASESPPPSPPADEESKAAQ